MKTKNKINFETEIKSINFIFNEYPLLSFSYKDIALCDVETKKLFSYRVSLFENSIESEVVFFNLLIMNKESNKNADILEFILSKGILPDCIEIITIDDNTYQYEYFANGTKAITQRTKEQDLAVSFSKNPSNIIPEDFDHSVYCEQIDYKASILEPYIYEIDDEEFEYF